MEQLFFYACVFGQTRIAEILVKNSLNIKMELNSKPFKFLFMTPFHFAFHFFIVEMMIRNSDFYNFDFEAKGIDKRTGFHMACFFGSEEIVEIIMNNSKSDIDYPLIGIVQTYVNFRTDILNFFGRV